MLTLYKIFRYFPSIFNQIFIRFVIFQRESNGYTELVPLTEIIRKVRYPNQLFT
jgi:hypothetical protein